MSYPKEWQEDFDNEWDRLAFVYADEPDVLRLWDKGPCHFCSEIFRHQWERCRRLEHVLSQIIRALPSNKDWLDPALEAEARKILEES